MLNNVILLGLLAGTYDASYFKSTGTTTGTADPNEAVTGVVVAAVLTGIVLCIGWIAALQTCPATLIQAGLAFGVAAPCIMGFYVLAAGNVFGFIILELMAAIGLCYWYCVQSRIALAAKMIEITSQFLQKHFSLVAISVGTLCACIGFMLIWALSLYCTLKSQGLLTESTTPGQTTSQQLNQAGGLTLFYFFLSYFWGIQTFCNTLHVTCSGAFADWWLQGEQHEQGVMASLGRATTTSFGSICYGSLLIAIVQALKAMVRLSNENADGEENALMCFLRCCAMCILSCIEDIMEFMNTYAFVHVAIYGDDFCTAGEKTWNLIMSSGFDMIINDDLTHMALVVSAFGAACIGAGITFGVALAQNVASNTAGGMALVGFFITFGCCVIVMSLAMSCVATIYVCYCEKPAESLATHPVETEALTDAWREAYGGDGYNWVNVNGQWRPNGGAGHV